jgi:hypothetical protein
MGLVVYRKLKIAGNSRNSNLDLDKKKVELIRQVRRVR